ncbi:arylsulfatase [Comamonas sp. C11]|uniref:arylsulfatase n=1 Tax=Comamonas sp. C11 TaxID=2966554 RepID=UPI002110F6AB|nr:arylsulfatase [Comamonas sp. C11]UUC95035.1 sulfatase-like hydrolase/transferase [Comamonas sp. C11]
MATPRTENQGALVPHPHEDILPPADAPFGGVIGNTYKESKAEWPSPVRPPKDAPNIVVVLLDDLGFGHLSCYGGPIEAPCIGKLATNGLRYTNFHTTSLCSPSRAALLTGRNHHSVGFAVISELSTGFPGSNAYMPRSASTVAEVLKQSGYSTFAVGKWHLTPPTEVTAAGPFSRWPLGMGFERFYGFLPGETDHWHPMLTCDNHRIPTPERADYHLSEDLVDQAIAMIQDPQQVATGRPFFLYLAFGAPHAPFHVPQSYIEKYKGKFDQGWDQVRTETFERQKVLGIIPRNSKLPPRNPGIAGWGSLDADARRLYARMQEAFAGFVDHTDAQIGRLVATLQRLGQFDNTLILVLSDNGASQEGQEHGTTNTERFRNLLPMNVQEMIKDIDRIGSKHTDTHYPAGWGMAGNAPFRRWKRDTHRGGNTDPLVVHLPSGVAHASGIRTQYHHITDLYPTLLEMAGVSVPRVINGNEQKPLEGISLAYTFQDAEARTRKHVQYYEMLGCRALWSDGWMAVTWHKPGTDWEEDQWELYHQDDDYTQANDLSREHPEKLKALIDLWWEEARKHNVLPLDDRFRERALDRTRPVAAERRAAYAYYPGSSPVPITAMPRLLNHSHTITARIEVPAGGAEGVIVALGSELGGWSLFMKSGRAYYVHNRLKIDCHRVSSAPILPGRVELRFEFVATGIGMGTGQLFVNGESQSEPVEIRTAPIGYSAVHDGIQIGRQWGSATAYEDYVGEFAFTGTIDHVLVSPGEAV